MRARILIESVEVQTSKNIKKIEAILRKPVSFYFNKKSEFEINNLTDGKPGLCIMFGKDKDFSRLLLFTNSVETAVGIINTASLYGYNYFYQSNEVKFDEIAKIWDKNPNIVRNSVMKLSKFIKSDFSDLCQNLRKCGFWWEGGSVIEFDFMRCQIDKGNLPKDFKIKN